MNNHKQLHHRLQHRSVWTAVVVGDAMRRARQYHQGLRDDERGVVSIEYVLLAAAAAIIAVALGALILAKVNEAGENISTTVDI